MDDCLEASRLSQLGTILIPRIERFLAKQHLKIQQRALDGFVIDGHGDLHCSNIFIFDEAPILFDCLEFDDELRMVDVLDELAFLVMDLEARGFNQFADLLLNTYLEHHRCVKSEEDLNLFYYFKLYRATVRAKANLMPWESPSCKSIALPRFDRELR
jgi:aminoglycoside phosphotransferase family enzyme